MIDVDNPGEGVLRLTLNRPDSLNAFTFDMVETFIAALEKVRFDLSVRVVIITGAGQRFCAGLDTRASGSPDWVDESAGKAQRIRAVMAKLGSIPLLMRKLPQPVIVAVNGATAGLGYSIALAGDLCIAARSAKFVNAFHNMGTGHELGFSYMLPRLIGYQRAAEIILTGKQIMAEEAAAMGMILRAVPDDLLQSEVLQLADQIMLNCPIGIEITKQSMWHNADVSSLDAAIELENRGIFMSQSTEDAAEKRRSMVEKRSPTFRQQ
ncbi:MAG TPA: enoyl-CoA hydratase-related protein [Pseudomonas sp.]|nr:enoyl-CoA hydratase-related protein [Pseudomonas sp.]